MQKLSLAERLAQIDTPAPDFDPENDLANEARDEQIHQATEHYIENEASAIRRKLDSIVDPRYEGARVSRTQLSQAAEQRTEFSSESDLEDDDEEIASDASGDESEAPPSAPQSEEEDEDFLDQQAVADENSVAVSQDAAQAQPSLQGVRDADRTKGIAISHQTSIWDSLLDARIRLQKSVSASNRLSPETTANIRSLESYSSSLKRVLEESVMLSNDLFELQEHLLKANDDVQVPPRKRQRIEPESSLENATEVIKAQSEAAMLLEGSYHSQLIPVLTKWSSKVQAVAPSVLMPSARGSFASLANRQPKSVVQLVDDLLSDQTKLLTRTQSYRGKNDRLGREATEEETADVELFDDTDFYQQLLRDVIDSRGNNVVGGDDWRVIQKNKKARKKVDTKASKGRKLRYETHEKLQNFMVPIPSDQGWHEEQVDELFGSLLGRSLKISSNGSEEPSHVSTAFRIF